MPVAIERDLFGMTSDGRKVTRFTLTNTNGTVVRILDFGAIIQAILVPDIQGKLDDVTAGFDTIAEYEKNPAYFGAVVGRVANRIQGGEFAIDGVKYKVALNQPPNHSHGGLIGFDKKIWSCRVESGNRLVMSLTSEDGDEGYPGTLSVEVTYSLADDNALSIDYTATVDDKPTIVNLTNHAYFNLAGHYAENIYDHELAVLADKYLPKHEDGIPTGDVSNVDGTPFDLRCNVKLGDRLRQVYGAPGVHGFDHNFCISPAEGVAIARFTHTTSGRVLEIFTDQPGVQLYTGNHLDGLLGKSGAVYKQHSSLTLETQNYPDAVHRTNFPSCVLRPGETYRHRCIYKFSVLE